MSDFYIYLPSNSSAAYYWDNTLSRFTTHLPQRLNLDEEWVCGLCEIMYNSWTPSSNPPPMDENTVYLSSKGESELVYFPTKINDSLDTFFVEILSRIQNHHLGQQILQELLRELNSAYSLAETTQFYPPYPSNTRTNVILHKGKEIRFAVDHYKTLGELVTEINCCSIDVGTRKELLATALSLLVHHANFFHDKIVENQDHNLAFIYLDIINPVISGDVLAKTLRVVDINMKGGHSIFNPIYYHSQSRHTFESVEVAIRNTNGNFVDFRSGSTPTLVVLHFKRQSTI